MKKIEVEAHVFKSEIPKLVIENALQEISTIYPGKLVKFVGVRQGDDGGLVVYADVHDVVEHYQVTEE